MAIRIALGAMAHRDAGGAGLSRYAGELARAMLRQDPALVAYTASVSLRAEYGERIRLTRAAVLSDGGFRGNVLRLLWHQLALPRSLRRLDAGIFCSLGPDGMVAPSCPQLVTIHDVIPLRYPEANPRMQYYYRIVLPRVLAASAGIITVSEATRSDLYHFYDLGDKPIFVVPQGYARGVFRPLDESETAAVRSRYRLRDYVLAVGEPRPYKNTDGLLKAFARIPIPDLQLAIAGAPAGASRGLLSLVRELGIADRVRFLGHVSDSELAALYSSAVLFAFPSFWEGFGLPPLEAMACGCPVVASSAASIPEVCADAAVYVDPENVDAIAAAIARVAGDSPLRTELRQRGLVRAEQFSYDVAAERTLQILRTSVGQDDEYRSTEAGSVAGAADSGAPGG